MIIELFGLPASGKSAIAKALRLYGWPTARVTTKRGLIGYAALYTLIHPVRSARLFLYLLRYAGSGKLFYLKCMNLFVTAHANVMKAHFLPRAVLDQGPYQNLLSLFEDTPPSKELFRLLELLPRPDVLFIVSISEEERMRRMEARKALPREEYGEAYARTFAESRSALFEAAHAALKVVFPKERRVVVANAEETIAVLNRYDARPWAHIDRVLSYTSALGNMPLLDVGAGRGKFLFAAHVRGLPAVGLEKNPAYIEHIRKQAVEEKASVEVYEGLAEAMPFNDAGFAFANVAEVIEHVEQPALLLSELHRVLVPDAHAYVSVPNRFGCIDPHYKLPFINWLPRALAVKVLRKMGREKQDGDAGRQRIETMHYMTRAAFVALAKQHGFSVQDIRFDRIEGLALPGSLRFLLQLLYLPFRFAYFDTFHFILKREELHFSYVTAARMPTEKAHGISIASMCNAFSLCGQKVSLIIPTRKKLIKEDLFSYYGIHRSFVVRTIAIPDFIGRGLTHPLFFFLQRLWFVAALKRVGVPSGTVYTREPEIVAAFSGTHKVVFEAHRWPKGKAGTLQAQLLAGAHLVVCNSRGTEMAVQAAGLTQTVVAPNGYSPKAFSEAPRSREELGLPEGFLALYAGSMLPWKGSDTVREAAQLFEGETGISIVVIGGERTGRSGALTEYGAVHPSEVPAYLCAADVLLLPNTRVNEESERFTSPIKLFEYLGAGKPIIASDLPSLREILAPDDAIFVAPGNSSALKEVISKLKNDAALLKYLGERSRVLALSYSWEARARRILDTLL